MYRHIGVLFAIVVIIGCLSVREVSASTWEGSIDSFEVKKIGSLPQSSYGEWCPSVQIQADIEGVGKRTACAWGGDRSVVTYYGTGGIHMAATLAHGQKRYPVKGICEGVMSCVYSPEGDVAVELAYSGFYFETKIIVSKKVGSSLQWKNNQRYLEYSQSMLRQPVVDGSGETAYIGSSALSSNGKWLAVELYNQGTGLVDLNTLVVRRITDAAHQYGYGMDPGQELAVSDDGTAVVVAGRNSGFRFILIQDKCGEVWRRTHPGRYESTVARCQESSLLIGYVAGFASTYHRPRFLNNSIIVYAYIYNRDEVLMISRIENAPSPVEYISLGDSFVSGEGEDDDAQYRPGTNTDKEKCHTSKRSYPYVLEAGAQNIGCSGAMIADIVGWPGYNGQQDRLKLFLETEHPRLKSEAIHSFVPGRIAQIDFVHTYQPKRITIGIGGNDAGFSEKIRACIMLDTCEWAKLENRERTALEIQALYPKFVEVFTRVVQSAPVAKVYSIGYPDIISTIDACDGVVGTMLNVEERNYLKHTVRYLNVIVLSAARTVGVSFVDIESVFKDHGLCSKSLPSAMNAIRFGDDIGVIPHLPDMKLFGSESFHPTPYGQQLMAEAIRQKISTGQYETCQLSCGAVVTIPSPDHYWNIATIPTRALLSNVTDVNRVTPGSEINISSTKPLFKPESTIVIKIQPGNVSIGTATSDIQGSVQQTQVTAPNVDGYYTVYLEGVTPDNERMSVYEGMEIVSTKNTVYSQSTLGDETVGIVGVGTHNTNTASLPFDQRTILKKESDLPIETGQGTQKQTTTTSPSLWFIAASVGVIGIIGICLVFVRMLKK